MTSHNVLVVKGRTSLMTHTFKLVGTFWDVLMKPTYARLRKGQTTLLRYVLGTLLMKTVPDISYICFRTFAFNGES